MNMIFLYGLFISFFGTVFIYLLKDKTKAGNGLLFFFFLSFTAKFIIELLNQHFNNLVLHNISTVIGLEKYIFFFLYIKYMTSDLRRIKRKDLWYFAPPTIMLIYMILSRYDYVNSTYPSVHYDIINTLLFLFMVFFLFMSFRLLRWHHEDLKYYYSYESAKINLYWVVGILVYDVLAYTGGLIWILFSARSEVDLYEEMSMYFNFNHTISLFVILVMGVWQKNISKTEISKVQIKKEEKERNEDYVEVLKKYMTEKKPFLDGDLTIENLADQLNVKKQYLSEVININLNTNFFNFIKEYRVNHMIELLQKEDSSNIKLLYLAYECGFNSKSAFNRAFKEITRSTPSEYLNKLKDKRS